MFSILLIVAFYFVLFRQAYLWAWKEMNALGPLTRKQILKRALVLSGKFAGREGPAGATRTVVLSRVIAGEGRCSLALLQRGDKLHVEMMDFARV